MKTLSTTYEKLGKRIYQLRKDRTMTQEDLAFKVGVDRSYMGFLERGEKNATVKILAKLASALKVSLSELFHSV